MTLEIEEDIHKSLVNRMLSLDNISSMVKTFNDNIVINATTYNEKFSLMMGMNYPEV